MLNMKFEGYYISNGLSQKIAINMNPASEKVLAELNKLNNTSTGTIIMENLASIEDIEPLSLTVYFNGGKYLLMLLDYDDEGYPNVRTAFNPKALRDDWEYINGELHSSTTIIDDLEVVKKCFLEFNSTGDVSKQLLS
ncbi:DUF6911 family protein [Psychrobacter sp. I-STPA6b]|uniref:DUF6911 family protein n=1 Tax=Psychrobacter sp. I-STPA6b TaxID=2585718 RepID=UPI001D0C1FB3|nr:hypothetical protein [Psychrobacter sp. I-STPA6b]